MREEASLDDRLAGSVPFTTMTAVAVAGWQLLRQLRAIGEDGASLTNARKRATVQFFLQRVVPEAEGLAASVLVGSDDLYAVSTDALLA
jgi:hypothetical protein